MADAPSLRVDSESVWVEARVALRHIDLTIVFQHFGQGVTICVELRGSVVPHNREVLFQRTTDVGTVGSWLTNKFVVGLIGSLPVRGLHAEESGESESSGETKNKILSLSAKDWAHKRVGEEPPDGRMTNKLSGELLQLDSVKLLHLYDFPLRQIVILRKEYRYKKEKDLRQYR